jgi:hypothetical protein
MVFDALRTMMVLCAYALLTVVRFLASSIAVVSRANATV